MGCRPARRAARVLTIWSLWESEADRSASDSALGKARDEAIKRVGGTLEIENFEQVVQSIVQPPKVGCQLNVVRVRMEPSSIDANIEWFKDQVVPQVSAQPGFCALRNMVNRQTGQALTGACLWTGILPTLRWPTCRRVGRPPKPEVSRSETSASARSSSPKSGSRFQTRDATRNAAVTERLDTEHLTRRVSCRFRRHACSRTLGSATRARKSNPGVRPSQGRSVTVRRVLRGPLRVQMMAIPRRFSSSPARGAPGTSSVSATHADGD